MSWTTWIGLATGVVMGMAGKLAPPPVILELGPVVPTPAATPAPADKKRLVTTFTLQNSVEAESVVGFEVTDVGDEGGGKTHVIALKRYSFSDQDPKLKGLSEQIMQKIRALERDLLEYAERAGPPEPRAPIGAEDLGQRRGGL